MAARSPRLATAAGAVPRRAAGSASRSARRAATGSASREPGERPSADYYFQEFIPGVPMSAVFVATASAVLVGRHRQLIGEPGCTRSRSGTPATSDRSRGSSRDGCVYSIGLDLAGATGLRGSVGVDFIADATTDRSWSKSTRGTRPLWKYSNSADGTHLAHGRMSYTVGPHTVRRRHPVAIVGKAIYLRPAPHQRSRRPARGTRTSPATSTLADARLRRHPGTRRR